MILNLKDYYEQVRSITSIYEDIIGKTCMDFQGLKTLYFDAIYASYLEGNFAECGCWRGGSSYLLANLLKPNKKLFVLDSFKGLSKPTDEDFEEVSDKIKFSTSEGMFAISKDKVSSFLSKYGDSVKLIEGFFSDTLVTNIDQELSDSVFSLVNIDVDLCEPYRRCIEFFYPRMVSNGIMIFDEYEFHGCPNSTKVINEFLAKINYDAIRHGNRLSVIVRK